MINEMTDNKEDYKIFWEQFGKNIKLAIHEDSNNKSKLSNLLRFYTSSSESDLTSLNDYVTRMKENQKQIYYITGENINSVKTSPFIEKLKKKNIEVIYMTDALDEYLVQQLTEFENYKLVSCTKEGSILEEDTEEEKNKLEELKKENKNLFFIIKEILVDKVEKVIISNRIVDSPCCLVTSEHGWSANMERIMKAQVLRDNTMSNYMISKKSLELNPDHRIIKELNRRCKIDKGDKTIKDLVWLMYDTSLLTSGFNLDDTSNFANRIHRMIDLGLNLDVDDIDDNDNIDINTNEVNDDSDTNDMEDVD